MCDSAELYEGNENCQWQCACRLATITTSPFLTDRVMWGCVRLSELPSSLFMMNSMCSLQWEYTEQGMFTARFSAPGPNAHRKDTCLNIVFGCTLALCFTSETCVSLIQWRSTQKLVTWDENNSTLFRWNVTYIGNIPSASDSFFIHFLPLFFDFLLQGACKYYKCVTMLRAN